MLVSPTINSFHGRIRSITGTDPAANAEITETVPDRRRWRFLSFRASLLTDANVASRRVFLVFNDGSTDLIYFPASANQAASLFLTHNFSPTTYSPGLVIADYISCAPSLILPAGFVIKTVTANIQAADNWGAPQLLVEEWIDPTS